VPPFSRPSNGRPIIGQAVPRTGPAPVPGGGTVFVPTGYFPFGFGGFGYGYGYGYGYGSGYDPYGYYGGYYGGYYDPMMDPYGYGGIEPYGGSYRQSSSSTYTGERASLRLKIKPRDAAVFVDGYAVGIVDDFDGIFQRLHLESGVHRVEIRAPGYETLTFEVRLDPDHTTTYTGQLKKIQ
jgi:PEGA domain